MIEDLLEGVGGTTGRVLKIGLLVGAGLVLGRGLRPVAKGAFRGYMAASDRVREFTAEASESLQDLYAEAKAERDEEMAEGEEAEARRPARARRHRPEPAGEQGEA